MHLTNWGRRVTAALVFCTLLSISLYLWSPLHRHTVQGRQACPFFQFEQSSGLEASGHVSIEPPQVLYYQQPEEAEAPMASVAAWEQCSDRAPPAKHLLSQLKS
jgi:hypothetical protein